MPYFPQKSSLLNHINKVLAGHAHIIIFDLMTFLMFSVHNACERSTGVNLTIIYVYACLAWATQTYFGKLNRFIPQTYNMVTLRKKSTNLFFFNLIMCLCERWIQNACMYQGLQFNKPICSFLLTGWDGENKSSLAPAVMFLLNLPHGRS